MQALIKLKKPIKEKDAIDAGSPNETETIDHMNHKKRQKAMNWGPLLLVAESQGCDDSSVQQQSMECVLIANHTIN